MPLLVFITFWLLPLQAHAYLDPGTGSMIIQLVIGAVVAAGVTIKVYFQGIKRLILRLFGRSALTIQKTDE